VFASDRDVPEVGRRVPVTRDGRDRQSGQDRSERLREESLPESLTSSFCLLGSGLGDDAVDQSPPAVDRSGDGVGWDRHSFVDDPTEFDAEPDGQFVASRHREVVPSLGGGRDCRRVTPVCGHGGPSA